MSALDRLADTAGIEPRYWDIQGRLHERSPETARRLLHAMAIPARNEEEIAASLTALSEAPWREVLPPAIIAREEREIEAPLRLPENVQWARWSLVLENGEERSGECDLFALPVEDRAAMARGALVLRRLRLAAAPCGYHRLRVNEFSAQLIVAPLRCHLPPGKRYWGIAAQLYAIRSARNWGIGDFADLRTLANWAAANGADVIGVNPLHALFLDTPQGASPYSPNSRLFLNPLYLDIAAIPDFVESAEARALMESPAVANMIQASRAAECVDYRSIAAAKMAVLERLYAHFATKRESDDRRRAFRKFVSEGGNDLGNFAAFQMLSEHFGTHDRMRWGDACDPASPETARLANAHRSRISFFQYLQWQCDEQIFSARAPDMKIGLYNDLAVSADALSADVWANQDLFMTEARVGAPPDPFNEAGQEWGVAPFNPHRLRESGYAHFIALLRANMRHAGALRIDHVMGLQRLFVILAGAPPAEGAYLSYPLEDLLAIVALESRRNRCMVIGEDLGTVPEGFRERMAQADMLSCRVFYFQKEHGRFQLPQEYPHLACVSASTHDLATLRGFWECKDILAKARLGIFSSAAEEQRARDERARDKRAILNALAEENLLPDEMDRQAAIPPEWTPILADAIHLYLARTPGMLMVAQLDDLAGEPLQANLPGSTNGYPSWRRRLCRSLEELPLDSGSRQTMAAIARERRSG